MMKPKTPPLMLLDPPPEKIEPLSPELERIAAAAGATETEQRIADAPPPPPPDLTNWPEQARDLVSMACGMILPFYAELVPIWTEDRQRQVAEALAPVLRKYDLQIPDLLAKWAPELGLAIVVLPIAIETRRALALAAKERAKNAPPKDPAKSPPGAPAGVEGQVPIVETTAPGALHLRV